MIESEDDHSDDVDSQGSRSRGASTKSDSDAPSGDEDADSNSDGSSDEGPVVAKSEVHKRAVIQSGKRQKDPLAVYRKFAAFTCRAVNPFQAWGLVLDVAVRLESGTWHHIGSNAEMDEEE